MSSSSSSSSSSSRQPSFVGQEVFHDTANQLQKKKSSTSRPAPASSPAAAVLDVLDAPTPGVAPDKKGTDSYLTRSMPASAAKDKISPSPGVPVMSSMPSSTLTSSTTPTPTIMCCKYPGCSRSAKYRDEKDTPPIACQMHKRKGQYTINRERELLIATRDGDAFRTSDLGTPVVTAGAASSPPASRDVNDSPPSAGVGTAAASASLRPSTRSRNSGIRSSKPSRRKQAAKPFSPPAKVFKGPRRQGLSIEGDDARESLHRPCLFPGCDAEPSYGLQGAARAVYCLSHKKGSMVHIVEKPLDLNTQGLKRKTAAGAATAAPDKKKDKKRNTAKNEVDLTPVTTITPATTATTADKKGAKEAWCKLKVEEGMEESGSGGGVEIIGMKTRCIEGAKMDGDVQPQGRVHDTELSASPVISEVERAVGGGQASTTATANSSSQGTTTTNALPPTATNRMAETFGMAPSVEMLRLRQARETARKEAQASGRRPRAPSRRALEASGRMQGEGAQWLTREKRAEQARVTAEMREQRRLYKDAGLQFGVVLEAFVEPTAVVSGEGENAGEGGLGGVEPARSDPSWQKISPALLTTVQQQQLISPGAGGRPEKRARPNSAENNA